MRKLLVLSVLGMALATAPAFAQHGHGGGGHGGYHGGGGFHGGYHGGFRGGWHGGYRGYYGWGPSIGFGFGGYYAPYYGPSYWPYYYGAPYDYYYDVPPPPPPVYDEDYDDAPPPPSRWHVTQAPGETDYELPDSVLFALDSAHVGADADQVLREIADAAERRPDARLVVEGHTDTSGSHAHNMQLSQARARAVADVLVRQGIPRDRIRTEGLGETRLAVQTGNGVREPRNRRVIIRLIGGN